MDQGGPDVTKELLTATLFGVIVWAIYVAGCHHKWIHAFEAAIFSICLCAVPFLIILDGGTYEPKDSESPAMRNLRGRGGISKD